MDMAPLHSAFNTGCMTANILIVEDNIDSRDYLAMLLQIHGYTVDIASDGVEGIEHVKANRPDLIISDITMPNLTGIEMLAKLRENPDFSKIPVFMVSAYGSGMLAEAVKIGADQALSKPIDGDLLLSLINQLNV
jgi:twitching motility two-component system response regulator PilH